MGGEPMPNRTRLRSEPRQRAERSSQMPGIRRQFEIHPSFSPALGVPHEARCTQGWGLWVAISCRLPDL
eukprot:3546572-Alexandrium_andersonii.AAC.1